MIAELLTYPFMQRALIAGAILGVLLASLGVLATLRKMAFFGEGVAHASLAGIAIAVLAGFTPLPFAIAWAVLIAVIIYTLERATKLPSDTLIGILFTASMALGVILIGQTQGYQPELLSFLFGSILTIKSIDLIIIASFS
ncbi:MAG: metal ABC transporter permease, partial [bacterium]